MQADIHYTSTRGEEARQRDLPAEHIRRRKSGSEQPYPVEIRDVPAGAQGILPRRNRLSCSSTHKSRVKDFFDPQQLSRSTTPRSSAW